MNRKLGFLLYCASAISQSRNTFTAGRRRARLWADHIIGKTGRQAEFERPYQPACGKIVGD